MKGTEKPGSLVEQVITGEVEGRRPGEDPERDGETGSEVETRLQVTP